MERVVMGMGRINTFGPINWNAYYKRPPVILLFRFSFPHTQGAGKREKPSYTRTYPHYPHDISGIEGIFKRETGERLFC